MGYHGGVARATDTDSGEPAFTSDATEAVAGARRGFRRDVAVLVQVLRSSSLFVPLSRSVEDVPLGVDRAVGEELSLSPQLLFSDERTAFLPAFTRPEFLERATDRTGWTTSDGPLEYVTLPGPVALELALAVVDDDTVAGLLVNPFDGSELILHRHEIASIAQGRPLPLVGYVNEIPFGGDEERLIAEMTDPEPAEITRAIEEVLAGAGTEPAPTFVLSRTFNPERDLEPHLTLNVTSIGPDEARGELAGRLAAALDGLLPPPGYIDILFDDPKPSEDRKPTPRTS